MKDAKFTESVLIPKTPFAFIWFVIKPYKGLLFLAIFLTFLQQLFTDLTPFALQGFIDTASVYKEGDPIREVFLWLLASPALLLLSVVTIRTIGFVMNFYTVHIRTDCSKHLFRYLSLHSLSYFNDRFSESLASKVSIISSSVKIQEESNMEILSFLPIGYQKVTDTRDESFIYQLRYVCTVKPFGPFIAIAENTSKLCCGDRTR